MMAMRIIVLLVVVGVSGCSDHPVVQQDAAMIERTCSFTCTFSMVCGTQHAEASHVVRYPYDLNGALALVGYSQGWQDSCFDLCPNALNWDGNDLSKDHCLQVGCHQDDCAPPLTDAGVSQ